jgi:hypothetical protein
MAIKNDAGSGKITSITIVAQRDNGKQSRGQKAFNALIREIEGRREELRVWGQTDVAYQQRYAEELLPLQRRLLDLQFRMVLSLDQALDYQRDLNRSERQAISELVTTFAAALLNSGDDRAELKEIYNKHSGSDFDAEVEEADKIAEMLFSDLADDDIETPDETTSGPRGAFKNDDPQAGGEAAARDEAETEQSPRKRAAEARERADQQQLSRSLREVYRRLVVALHPDLEPDPRERERKTELMQRVNAAYSQKNLLQLLELQLELEHIGQGDIDNIGEDRLKHYNKILKQQLAELDAEIQEIEHAYRLRLDMAPFSAVTPEIVMYHFSADLAGLRRGIRELGKDLRVFADVRMLKMWLTGFKRSRRWPSR